MKLHPGHAMLIQKRKAGDRVLENDEAALLPNQAKEMSGTRMEFRRGAELFFLSLRRAWVRDARQVFWSPKPERRHYMEAQRRQHPPGLKHRVGTG